MLAVRCGGIIPLIALAALAVAPQQAAASGRGFRPAYSPHYGCYGYCPGPLPTPRPTPRPMPYWGCYGYCPGPLYPPYPTPVPVPYPYPLYPPYPTPVPIPSYYGGNIYDDSPSTALPAPAAGNGSAAKGKVASLIDRLKDSDSRVRLEATLSLAKVSEDALPALREALKSPDRLVRMGAALALGHMGTTAKVAVPDLKTALKDPEVAVRCHAAQALWRITRQADDALPVLVQALAASKDRNVRMGVVTTLSQMGKAAWQAEPALEGALKDADPQVRLGAVVALLVDEVVRLPAPRRERPGPEIGCAGHRIREPAPC